MPAEKDRTDISPRPSRSRWLRLACIVAVLLIGAIIAAPWIVTRTGLAERVVASVLADFEGTVRWNKLSLGWFSPVVVEQIEIVDSERAELMRIERLVSQRTLAGLLLNRQHPGLIRLERPHLYVDQRRDGTNIEDALGPWLQAESQESANVNFAVEITDGQVTLRDADSERRWYASDVNLLVKLPGSGQSITAKLGARVHQRELEDGGKLQLDLAYFAGEAGRGDAAKGKVTLLCRDIPLEAADAVLQRFAGDLRLAGSLTGECQYDWSGSGASQSIAFREVSFRKLAIAAPTWLGSDVPRLELVTLDGKCARQQGLWKFDNLALQSDAGQLKLAAQFADLQSQNLIATVSQALTHGTYVLRGHFDLARLSQLLPATLRMHAASRWTAGNLDLSLTSTDEQGGHRWAGELRAAELAGVHQGQPIALDYPIQLTLAARETPAGPVVEQLKCESSFANLTAYGTLETGSLKAEGDLQQLALELGRFFDFGQLQLQGRMSVDAAWDRTAGRVVEAQGRAHLEDLQVRIADQVAWNEPRLIAALASRGELDQNRLVRLEQLLIAVDAGDDHFNVQLASPVDRPTLQSEWPLKWKLQGNLAAWQARWPLHPTARQPLEGMLHAAGEASLSPRQIVLKSLQLQINNVRATVAGAVIEEPQILGGGEARWDLARGSVHVPQADLTSSLLALRAKEIDLELASTRPVLRGTIDARGDLERIGGLLQMGTEAADAWRFAGHAEARVVCQSDASTSAASWEMHVTNFTCTPPHGETAGSRHLARTGRPAGFAKPAPVAALWQENELTFSGEVTYASAQDRLQIANCRIAGDAVQVEARGSVSALREQCAVDLAGELAYDLEKISQKLRPRLGESVLLTGRDRKPFAVSGPLAVTDVSATVRTSAESGGTSWYRRLAGLRGHCALGWQTLRCYGIDVGPGTLQTRLADGWLLCEPLRLAMAQGQVNLKPRVDLRSDPPILTLDQGPVLERVLISPELCRGWLKFIAPLIADATAAQGTFSLQLAEAAIPLTAPDAARAAGTLQIHSAQVGPGPLTQPFVLVGEQLKATIQRRPVGTGAAGQWLALPEQQIAFRVADRRVEHQALQLNVADLTFRSRGSVGFDQSLALLVDMPLRPEWLSPGPLQTALRGQSLQIPVGGTISEPRLDRSGLEQLTAQLLQGAATRLLDEQLQRGFQKLFQ